MWLLRCRQLVCHSYTFFFKFVQFVQICHIMVMSYDCCLYIALRKKKQSLIENLFVFYRRLKIVIDVFVRQRITFSKPIKRGRDNIMRLVTGTGNPLADGDLCCVQELGATKARPAVALSADLTPFFPVYGV